MKHIKALLTFCPSRELFLKPLFLQVRPPSLHSGLSQYQPPSHTTTSPPAMMPAVSQPNQMMGPSRVDEMNSQPPQQQQSLHDMSVRQQGNTPLHHPDGLEEDGSETGT